MGSRLVWQNAEIILNSTDLSEQVTQVSLTLGYALLQAPAMGDETELSVQGLKQYSGQLTFNQSFDSVGVDQTINDILASRQSVLMELMKDRDSAIGTGNPKYRGLVVLGNYQPFQGSAGQVATATLDFQAAGDISRLTA